jgi:hypothetical protein
MNTTTRPRVQRPSAARATHRAEAAGLRPQSRSARAVTPHPRGTRDPRTARGRLR